MFILIAWFVFSATIVLCQDTGITTIILVRHAEKDLTQSTSDPDLSAEGRERANKLVEVLKQTEIQAVFSTDFKRTRQTVEPLTTSRSLPVYVYDAKNLAEVDSMLQRYAGQTILVSGHSNTVPQFVNYLLGEEKYKPTEDGEYGNMIIVSVSRQKKRDVKVVWVKY